MGDAVIWSNIFPVFFHIDKYHHINGCFQFGFYHNQFHGRYDGSEFVGADTKKLFQQQHNHKHGGVDGDALRDDALDIFQ